MHFSSWMKALLWLIPLVLLGPKPAHALSLEASKRLVEGDTEQRLLALSEVVAAGDASAVVFLQALADDAVKISGGKAWIVNPGLAPNQAIDPLTGASGTLGEDARDVVSNNRFRGEIETALAALKLSSPDAALRETALKALLKSPDPSKLPLLQTALAQETNASLRALTVLAIAAAEINADQAKLRLQAAQRLASSQTPDTQRLLTERLALESDPQVRAGLKQSLTRIETALKWGEQLGALFSGVSLGSILLLVALGLAITYGLMGVINMAHGELMMIGAYATYVVQTAFARFCPPSFFDAYLLLAVPVAFLSSALVGALLERTVLRFLYGRPLESLLATWGISLVLMQAVRSIFGAQNVAVENPAWMSGGIEVLPNLLLPYNRLIIIAFSALVLLGLYLLIAKTRLGLFVRGVTQNRAMASCVGVNTARVDTYAFALGAGIAGLAGCALSQVGNVGPDLGQNYIVDAFMVVVLGGVGQLAGTVYAALGLGLISKFLEGFVGAVLAKICVLIVVIFFIQKRPQGIFAIKGRSMEA